ncbi:MAG: amidohydrolase family protein, partial [Clostridia bacterium]|nr:amidohydrolase family protein [Clostridia bacterium]
MKIIDTHAHVYPDKIADKASNATGIFYGIPPHFNGSVGKLLERGDRAGIDHYVVSSIATTPAQVHAINTYISSLVSENCNKFTGLGTLQQDLEDVEGAVEEIISLGLKGIKLHPDIQRVKLNDERVLRFFEVVGERLPVLVHFGDKRYDNSNPEEVKPVLDAFPHTRFIGANF